MKNLPRSAQVYVGVVIALGVCQLLLFAPWSGLHPYSAGAREHSPALFFSLLLLSSVCSAFKVSLPLAGSS